MSRECPETDFLATMLPKLSAFYISAYKAWEVIVSTRKQKSDCTHSSQYYLLGMIIYSLYIQMHCYLLDLRAMLGFERWQSANKGLPLG